MCDKEVTLVNDVIQQLSSVTGVKYSDEQLQVLNHKGGMCIVACAGAGKTSVLVSLLAKRVSSGEIHDTSKLLVTTYSVAGREELQVRINKLLNKMGIPNKIEIRTLHSAYFKILKSLNMLGKIGTGGQRLLALQQAIKECGERLDDEEVQQLDSLISFQINNMMPDNVLYGDVNFNLEMSLETYSKIRKTFAQKKAEMGFIDFDDLQLQLYMMMKKDETVREYVKSLWDYFYIDEFQDVSKLQYEILRMMLKDPSKLVVIGDDDQCIYQWRGADPSIILNICGTYDIERFILSTNYRCGGEIVSHANTGIQNNSKRHVKQMTPFNDGGEINLIKSCNENYYEMSRKAFNKIRELILDGVAEEDISVLCRNNAHGVILNNMLLNEGIIHRASEDVRFHNHFFVKDLMACVEMGNNTYNFNYVSANLWKIVPFLSAKNSAMIGKIMKDCGCNFAQALKSFLIDICYISESAFDDDIKRMQFDTKKYYNIRLTEETKAGIVQVYNIITDNEPFEACQKMTQLYCERTIGFLYKSRDAEKIITGIKDYLKSLLAFGYDYYANTIAKAKNLSEFEIEPGRRCINLSTMHGSKGKEWKHVIMLGVDGYSCPGMKRVSTYKDSGRTNEDISVYVEQERRLHYVAMTRAKEELTIICDYNNLSPFLYEAFDIEHKTDDVNTHIVDWSLTGGYKGEKKDKYFAELEKSLKIIDVDKNESDATNTSEENDANIVFNENFSACIVDETEENKNEPLDMNDYLKDTEEFAQNCGEAEDEQHF